MTETPRTPDQLNDLDRRVYDLAVQTMPLAEIAVRLGISIRQADEKVQRILERMGVPDRESLRNGPLIPPDDPDEEPAPVEALPEAEHGLTRRRLLIGGSSLGVIAGSALAGYALSRRGAAPGPTAPSPEQPTQFIPPTTAIEPFGGLHIEEGEGHGARFEMRTFAPPEEIAWSHGLFKLRVSDGSVESLRFQVRPGDIHLDAEGFGQYRSSSKGRLVSAVHGPSARGYLVDTFDIRKSWSWPTEQALLVAAIDAGADSYLLFLEMIGGRSNRPGSECFCLRIDADSRLHYTGSIRLPLDGSIQPLGIQPDEPLVAIWSGAGTNDMRLNLLDLRTATIAQSSSPAIRSLGDVAPSPLDFQRLEDGRFLARWYWPGPENPIATRAVFEWTGGVWDTASTVEVPWQASVSPSGEYWLEEVAARSVTDEVDHGWREYWPTLEVGAIGESFAFRIRSAAFGTGDGMPLNRWLADGSGFVAMARATDPEAPLVDSYRYVVIPAGGDLTRLRELPYPGVPSERKWFEHSETRGVSPSPFNPSGFALGRTTYYDSSLDRSFAARVTSDVGPDHLDPWSAGEDYMVFALPHGGHGGSTPPVLLNLIRDEPPLENSFEFVVAGTGDSLRMRAGPGLEQAIIANLTDGTPLTLAEDADEPQGLQSFRIGDGIRWLFVSTEDGTTGWVSSSYLNWQ